ncbi:MAG: tetratricopeptide repeat protein [Desulfobacterales bacterium]|nr:tetratricopeptide repeat protein [Desulfobacterales bacterium]
MKKLFEFKRIELFFAFFAAVLILFCLPGLSIGQSLDEAVRLNEQFIQLYNQGRYEEAMLPAKRALEIHENLLGQEHPDVATSMNNLAVLYNSLSNYAKAESLHKRALETREKVLGPEHPDVALSLNNLAELYRSLGNYAKAEPLHKRALEIWEKVLGPEHPDVAASLNNLAGLYNSLGNYAQAEPLYKRALEIREKALGLEHPDVATTLNNLSQLYGSLGNYAQAEPLNKRALEIWEKVLGPEHPDVAKSLNNLAVVYNSLGNYAQAEPLYKRALEIIEKALGPEHPDVAKSLNNLAVVYGLLGNYAQAEPLHKRALEIREKALGQQHPDVANSLNNLAELYRFLGNYAQAEPLYKRALEIRENELGPEHPDVAATLNNLAELYRLLANYAQAEPLSKRALAICEKKLGPEHPNVASILNNLAVVYGFLGNYAQAEPLYKRALEIREKALDPEHPDVANSFNNLAALYESLGNYAQAELLYKRALEIEEKALSPEHPDVANSLNNLAALYRSLGNYAQAEPLYKRALEIREKALGPEHPDVANSLNSLALLYDSLGNYAQAEPLYKRSLEIRENVFGPEHPDVANSLNNLAGLYVPLGNYARAKPLYKRALAIWKKALGPEHPYVANSLNNLASFYILNGKIDIAFKIFMKGDIPEGLGECYLAKGEFKKAVKEFQRSLRDVRRKKFIITDHVGLGLACEGMRSFVKARQHFQNAVNLIEAQWKTLGLSARKTFLSGKVGANFSRLDAYEGMIRVIIRERNIGYQKESFLYAEKVKSRTLLELLAAKGAKGTEKKDSDILARDRRFQQEITMLKKRVSVLTELDSKAPEGEKDRAEQTLNKTLQDYEQFINEVKLQNTELASLITVETLSADKIQSLLDPSVTVLEYFTTKDNTFVWTITGKDIRVHKLSLGNKAILAMVNDLLLPNISDTSRRPEPIITISTGGVQNEKTGRREREKNRQRFLKATRNFYRSLIEPVKNNIRTESLIIVPHGVLHKVPFAALNDGKKYMADRYAISVVPSSAVIEYVVRKRNRNRGRLLAFANPVTDYVPLGFAETEINNISKLFPEKETYFRNRATETRAKERSDSPDIIHFACHGEFNDKQPMQSGLLLSKDRTNDGRLQVHELFALNLRNANLVVLSACDAALSRIYGGDDLVGLARGFIYAGTPSILATLWEVDDRSTSILMKKFYENWYKKGMRKPEALRKAQLSVKSMPGYEHPFYWAPFVMIGDWL